MNTPSRPVTPLSISTSTSNFPSYGQSVSIRIPELGSQRDFDDLLEGLGSDDLDDFELDGDALGEEDAVPFEAAPQTIDLFNFTGVMANPGFKTGRGVTLPPPSVTALERARKLLEETEDDMTEPSVKRRKLDGASSSPVPPEEPAYVASYLKRFSTTPFTSSSPPAFLAGFSTGSLKPIAPPSEESRRRALALLGEDIPENDAISSPFLSFHVDEFDSPQPLSPRSADQDRSAFSQGDPTAAIPHFGNDLDQQRTSFRPAVPGSNGGFTSGNGRSLPPPKRESLRKVAQIFEDDSDVAVFGPQPATSSAFTTGSGSTLPPPLLSSQSAAAAIFGDTSPAATSTGFKLASGSAAPDGNANREEEVLALFGETPSRTPAPSSRDIALSIMGEANSRSVSTPSRPTKPQYPSSQFRSPLPIAFRTPLRPHARMSAAPSVLKANDVNVKSRPIEITTPSAKLLGTGRTPISARRRPKKFVTPFKTPQMALKASSVGPTPVRAPTPLQDNPVFDLTIPSGRQSMRDAYVKPQYHETAELSEMGLPEDIWNLNLTNAKFYQFIDDQGSSLGPQAALQVLVHDGARLATLQWVENHWSMILWKIAGLIQAQPSLFDRRWNWEEVVEQLKYRYERECGAAQRPIIRRIQEQDSASGVPMVLCVSAIHRPAPQADQDGKIVAVKPFLELTDGWYRVKAEIDECLVRALNKGVINVGRKVAICGARLENTGEPTEVLDALHKSRIIISGNSTSLARWDARLGASEPSLASLRSLSPDGGLISLMAVTVEKVFPLAYCHADKSAAVEQPWDEAEEAVRADRWKETYQSESTRLREEMRVNLGSLEELANLLMSNAQDAESTQDTPPDDIDGEFDRLLIAKNPSELLRGMSDTKIIHLARYAQSRMEADLSDAEHDLQHQLQTVCPPRQIRDFRIVRLIDAVEGEKGHTRTALLTIWDASNVEIEEGGSYLASNLMPGRQGDWSVPKEGGAKKEIYLNSRRDTKWQVFERSAT